MPYMRRNQQGAVSQRNGRVVYLPKVRKRGLQSCAEPNPRVLVGTARTKIQAGKGAARRKDGLKYLIREKEVAHYEENDIGLSRLQKGNFAG